MSEKPNVDCPLCGMPMLIKLMKNGGYHLRCFGRQPVTHDITIFWRVYEGEAPVPKKNKRALREAEAHAEAEAVEQVSRADKILERLQKSNGGKAT